MIGSRPRFGAPVEAGTRSLVPVSESISFRFPFGAFVWNRPRAVFVREGDARTVIAVEDRTRQIQWALLAAGATAAIAIRFLHGRAAAR